LRRNHRPVCQLIAWLDYWDQIWY